MSFAKKGKGVSYAGRYTEMKILKKINKDKVICFFISFFSVVLIYGIFFAQNAFSDVVTFGKSGDSARQTLPSFIHLGYQIGNGIRDGVDVLVGNGSRSIHYDGLEWYIVYRFFAYLGYITRPVACYIMFYAFHTFLNMYCTQRLCFLYFGINRPLAVVIAVSVSFTALRTAWFPSFFVIYSLVLPSMYFMIAMITNSSKIICLLSSLVYVVIFHSGYSTVSCMLAAGVFVVSFLWGMLYGRLEIRKLITKTFFPAFIGAAVSFPYLWKLFISMKKVSAEGTTMFQALYLPIKFETLPSLIFFSYNKGPVEGGFLTIGLLWFFTCILLVISKVTKKMDKKNRIMFLFLISLNLLFLLVSIGEVLPFDVWFYEVPIFGSMHIRQRYLLTMMPYLYLALGLGIQCLGGQKERKDIRYAIVVFCAISLIVIGFAHDSFNWNSLIVELVCSGIGIYFVLNEGLTSCSFASVFVAEMICFTCNSFYQGNEITATKSSMAARSIAYDVNAQDRLDQYVRGLGIKEIYKYIGIETDNEVPIYVMNNYGWYHSQNVLLSNYLIYPLHGTAITKEYCEDIQVAYFNNFDWNYLFDTRADFAVLDQGVIDAQSDLYNNEVIDWEHECVYLSGEHVCVKVKKYIPRHYTDSDQRILDTKESLDNGYFYCPTLKNEDIVDFFTDNASEFRILLQAPSASEIQFSMYAADNYSYYLDGEEYTPKKDHGLAYFNVPKGKHEIQIIYKDNYEQMMRVIYAGYYSVLLVGVFIFGRREIKKLQKDVKCWKGN